MFRHVTLLEVEKQGQSTWRLIGPSGRTLGAFNVFADSLLRKHPFNTRRSYCRGLAAFLDYLFTAAEALQIDNQIQPITRTLLLEMVDAYDDYLVLGGASGKRIAVLVDSVHPSPLYRSTTSALMHAPIRKFLYLSEQLRKEIEELNAAGLVVNTVDASSLLPDMNNRMPVSEYQRRAMGETSMISGVLSGGPKLLKAAILPTVSSQVEYEERRAFPFDLIEPFIRQLPSFRDRTLYALLAASGCRMHEALQLLFDDVDVESGSIMLRDPAIRAHHPSYVSLAPIERDKLAWKGRTLSSTVLIEPFASLFFTNLEHYLRSEYVPHGQHRFVFQFLRRGLEGQPYFLSKPSSRSQVFKKAALLAGVDDHVQGPHSLRHAYGTYLLNYFPRINGDYGLPVALVQQLMGHANVKSTLKYARYDQDLIYLELRHANAMVFNGATAKTIIELKIEAMNNQVEKLQRQFLVEEIENDAKHDKRTAGIS